MKKLAALAVAVAAVWIGVLDPRLAAAGFFVVAGVVMLAIINGVHRNGLDGGL